MIKFLLTLVVIHSITSSPQHQICRFCGSLICKHHGLLTAGSSKAHIWLQAGHTCIVFVCKVCGPIRGLKVHGEVLTLRLDTKKICVMTSLGYICSTFTCHFTVNCGHDWEGVCYHVRNGDSLLFTCNMFYIKWNSNFKFWNDDLHDSSRLLTRWNNIRSDLMPEIIYGVQSAHNIASWGGWAYYNENSQSYFGLL